MKIDEVIQQPGLKERLLKEDIMKSLHVAIPGEIVSYDSTQRTAVIQPVIREWNDPGNPPLLLDVPVYMWGNFTFTPTKGDGCLVVCADSCIDSWITSGGVSTPVVSRNHSLSDGFAFCGFRQADGIDLKEALDSKLDKANIYNGLDKTVEGFALDARQGKVLKGFVDQKLDKDNVYNGLDKTVEGFALDARQGKVLKDTVDAKLDKTSVYNGLDKTTEGFALDARQGKALKELIQQSEHVYTAGQGLTLSNANQFYVTSANVSTMMNLLSTGSSDAQADDYLIAQYAGGGTTTTTFHRRPVSKVVNAARVKAALGTNSTHNNEYLRKDGTWANPPQPDISGKVNKSGDTMTGSLVLSGGAKIQYNGTKYGVGDILKVVDDGDQYGLGVVIGRGGLVVIGAGESQDAIASGKSAGEETLYLGSDGEIRFMPNCNSGVASAKVLLINTKGQLLRNNYYGSWVAGRDNALIRTQSSGDGYCPILSVKSYNGSWELGPYTTTNGLYLTFISDTRYNAGQNTQGGQYYFKPLGENKLADMATAIKNITRSGTTFTATRMDDTTFTFTQQDNNSWRGFQHKGYQKQYTVAANSGIVLKASDFGVSTPSGYTPVAIAYINTDNSNVYPYYLDALATGNSTMVALRNTTGSQITNTCAIRILYLQT